MMKTLITILFSLFMVSINSQAASMMDGFTDPEDGMFDVSHWLAEKKGFFPVPIIITEPAVGYGVGAALVFLHDPLAGRVPDGETFDPHSKDAEGKLIPPSISAVFGMYTENDTWFAGGAHMGVWKNDNIRYTGAIATGSINMKFYGLGLTNDKAIDFNIEPEILYQGIKFRLNDSGFFAGINYLLVNTNSEFNLSAIDPSFIIESNSRDAAAIFTLDYDSRDTIFTPSSGFNASIEASLFREAVGGDNEFEKYKAKLIYFSPIADSFVLGLRGEVETVDGEPFVEVPFYQYPFVYLRGIPIMRYQGETVGVAEAELRWNFTPRWSVVGFGGAGRFTDISGDEPASNVYSKGAGIRYFIARRFGAHVGFDIAKGPEDTAFYLQFGHPWR
ncbi:MAG: glyceraldehyde-3-phosphate dehydrogenase [Gammaproteobacteria bacterium]|nr:MAG: glyceraldehyde-3-phosphate dehydrogenase [Gammaproteobacteria bacterium]